MPLEEYTNLLARDMIKALNAATRRRVTAKAPRRGKRK
jgi:hypothetical protein